jgi:hypothetical protein
MDFDLFKKIWYLKPRRITFQIFIFQVLPNENEN